MTLAGLVVARDAAAQLGPCLASLRGVDRMYVADHRSTDATARVAAEAGAEVFAVEGTLGAAREAARARCSATWIIGLDADERLPNGAVTAVREAIRAHPDVAAFQLPIRTYVGQRFLRWGGLYPARRVRVFRRDAARWRAQDQVHERPLLVGPVRTLPIPVEHLSFGDWPHLRRKWRRYAELAAAARVAAGRRPASAASVAVRSGWRWVRCFLVRGGLFMGRDGLRLANALAAVPWWRSQAERGLRGSAAPAES